MYFPHIIAQFPPPGVVTDPRRRNPGTGLEISLCLFLSEEERGRRESQRERGRHRRAQKRAEKEERNDSL